MILITGASDNHYASLINMIESFIKYKDSNQLVIYNLGIEETNWQNLIIKYDEYKFIYKIFDYSKYPEWFNININAGEYAWKPVIIYDIYKEFENEIIIWMDAGNIITDDLKIIEDFTIENNIYSGISLGNIEDWTHPTTLNYLNYTNINEICRNAACLGFNTKIDSVKEFLTEFYICCQDRNCIAPEGSSRINHRQDQAVFTVLFYKYLYKYDIKAYNNDHYPTYICYSIHNDV